MEQIANVTTLSPLPFTTLTLQLQMHESRQLCCCCLVFIAQLNAICSGIVLDAVSLDSACRGSAVAVSCAGVASTCSCVFFALLDGGTGYVCGVNRQECRCILCCVAPSKSTWLSGARPSGGGLGQDWRRVTAQNGNNFERSCPHKKQNM